MSSWEGKSKGNKAGYQFFVWILKNFGVLPAYFILRFVAFYFFLSSGKSSRLVYSLYRQRLGYSRFASLFKIYTNYRLLGQGIIDKVVVMSGIANKFTYEFDGEENLREMAAGRRGGILLSAHIGNWDMAGHLLKRLETKINIVMYDGEHKKIKEYLAAVTGKKSINIIVIKNDLTHIYEISDALKNNELICMHADRFLEGNKTLAVNFLGQDARFPLGPFTLAATFKVPVSFVFALKENNLHYHFFAGKPVQYAHLPKAAIVPAIAKDFAAAMEAKVKEYPAQWFNYYNFWAV